MHWSIEIISIRYVFNVRIGDLIRFISDASFIFKQLQQLIWQHLVIQIRRNMLTKYTWKFQFKPLKVVNIIGDTLYGISDFKQIKSFKDVFFLNWSLYLGLHEVVIYRCWRRMCFIYVSKMYQLHLEQASVTTFTGYPMFISNTMY